jgi:hypothetical protein
VANEGEKTAIFHSNFAQIHFSVSKYFFAFIFTSNFHDGAISPTHERTEGRAPVWGSEFTSKDVALQGGIQQKPLLG